MASAVAEAPKKRMSLHDEILAEHRSWFVQIQEQEQGSVKSMDDRVLLPLIVGTFGVACAGLYKATQYFDSAIKKEDMELYGEYISTDATQKKPDTDVEPFIPEDDEPDEPKADDAKKVE